MAAPYSHSSSLFVTKDGAPIRFYVRPGPIKRQLAPLITHGGGVVCRYQEPGAFLLADPTEGQQNPGFISNTYVTDCVSHNRCLSPRPYRLLPPWAMKTRAAQRRSSSSKLPAVTEGPGVMENQEEGAAIDLSSNKESAERSENPNMEETSGEREDVEQIGYHSPKRPYRNREGYKGSPAIDLTNKRKANISGHRDTGISAVTKTEDATVEGNKRKTNVSALRETKTDEGKMGMSKLKMAPGKKEGHSSNSPASRGAIAMDSAADQASSREGDESDDRDTMETAPSTSSGSRNKLPSLDIEQTLNDDMNFSPDPRTSTPAPGNPNTVMDLKTDTGHDIKDGESHLATQFRRPKRKVACKTRNDDGETQHSPNRKQKRAEQQTSIHEIPRDGVTMEEGGQAIQESPIGEALMSVPKIRVIQDQTGEQAATEESHRAESPAGQKGLITEIDTDVERAKSQQVKPVTPPHKGVSALELGRMAFSDEEDMAILLYIRDNVSTSHTITGNILWKDMEKKKVLNRTWQSMKSRYVKYLVNHKHKYKLPPRCSPIPSKDSNLETNGSWLKCASTSTVTQRKSESSPLSAIDDTPCDANPSRVFAGSPQECDSHPPSVSVTQKCDPVLPSVSDTQKCDPVLPSVSDTQKCDPVLPTVSDTQKCDPVIPSVSDTQKCDPVLPSTSGIQKCDPVLPTVSDTQKCDPVLPSTSGIQRCDPALPSVSAIQRCDPMIPSVSAIQRCDPMIPSASGTEKCDPVLPSSSADAHQSCSVTQQGALTSANTPGTNISSKKQSILTPRKRSTNATLNESSLQGNKNLSSHSAETVPSNGEDSDDWKDLHIFERANMEFEEAHDDINSEQPAQAVSQTEDNNGESPMDETPSTSQASESNGLREAMMDLMKEFDLDVSRVTQALFFNSGELVSTRHFLRTGTRPDRYPIWEPKDDLDLKNNPKMKSQLIKKYGAYNVTRRVAFLAS